MISPEREKKYQDFVQTHSEDGVYQPRKGLGGLLSILTPDPKGIVLAGMEMGEVYLSRQSPHQQTLSFLERLGLPKELFPLTDRADWCYCEIKREGEVTDGSLVKIGAVVKQAILHTGEGLKFGYMKSLAGEELGGPLLPYAIEFVHRSAELPHPPRYNSLWKVLGAVSSPTDQRRPLITYEVIKFLIDHPQEHHEAELTEGVGSYSMRVSNVLNSLGKCGVINYRTLVEIEGKKPRGWSKYFLQQPQALVEGDQLYKQLKKERGVKRGVIRKSNVLKVVDYIRDHPQEEYEGSSLERLLSIQPHIIGRVLSRLELMGVLGRPKPGFKAGERCTSISANECTRLFYDLICQPAWETADTLSPLPSKPWKKEQVTIFLQNYQEERTHIGPPGGKQVRATLFEILSGNGEMKLSHISEIFNTRSDRTLKSNTLASQLQLLIRQGLLKQPRPGFYRLKQL